MVRWKQIEAALARLERETGTVHKDPGGRLTVALAYPNNYSVGMSSLALQILYDAFNRRHDVVCERVFWDPAEAAADLPLISLESQAPVRGFDVWAFTISFEMDYFNVVAMLRQAGIPPLAANREEAERFPLLIAGGPGISMNPEPMAAFFDAIVIGEGEEILGPLTDVLAGGRGTARSEVLDALAGLPGVYVPARMFAEDGLAPVRRLWVADAAHLDPVSRISTPDTEFGDMRLIEIARGCGRGCRYCLAGFAYRPPREQPMERILSWADVVTASDGAAPAGWESTPRTQPRIGLVSAAVSDHSQIDELARELLARGVRLSVSSMRTDPMSRPLVEALAQSGVQTLTIAPEAGSQRLRQSINKPQSETDLLSAVELAQEFNFPQLKMYFMVGHPEEEDDDVQQIVDLTLKARRLYRRRLSINATPFVPKPHTPFQWVAATPTKTIKRRQAIVTRALARHQVSVSADSPAGAEVQSILARGDRRLAQVLVDMHAPTAEEFRSALGMHHLAPEEYLRERGLDEALPWRVVQSGVSDEYLKREYRAAKEGRSGHRCPPERASGFGGPASNCRACGVCAPIEAGREKCS